VKIRPSHPGSLHRRLVVGVAAIAFVTGCSTSANKAASTSVASSTSVTASTAAPTTVAVLVGPLDANRQTIVDYSIKDAAKVGFTLDPECAAAVARQLSDADAALLASSTKDSIPGVTSGAVSSAGQAIGGKMLDCARGSTNTDLINKAVDAVIAHQGSQHLDRSCVVKAFSRLSDDQLKLVAAAGPNSTDPRLGGAAFALFDCITIG